MLTVRDHYRDEVGILNLESQDVTITGNYFENGDVPALYSKSAVVMMENNTGVN